VKPSILAACILLTLLAAPSPAKSPKTAHRKSTRSKTAAKTSDQIMNAQIQLDRAHFSPGEIDGEDGENFHVALRGYQSDRKLPVTGKLDAATIASLNTDKAPMLVPYTITAEDTKGPFEPIPTDLMAQARLKALGYSSIQEELGERFHVSPKLLEKINHGKDLTKAGEQIMAPNVNADPIGEAARVVVSKTSRTVTAYGAGDKLLAQYPATIGSEHDPLPIGEWKVTTILHNPPFYYDPELFWNANPQDSKAKIAPGPNNPVGVVWIGLSKEHYGIHGTPEPGTIGHTESHGCIRLTNWDAEELSKAVKRGTPVSLEE
jgi:lipoprotein-anchoring transpeptidase ErfK/SrfK